MDSIYADAYPSAVDFAAEETGFPDCKFASAPPFDFEAAMTDRIVWPEG